MPVQRATTDAAIAACFPVFRILRPHLLTEAAFVERVKRQQIRGYQMVCLVDDGDVVAAAGFRIQEFLAWGKVLYVDDLITDPEKRGRGFGSSLMDWLRDHATAEGCDELHLDSGYQRGDAHRLYLNKGMRMSSHHFSMGLKHDDAGR